MANQLRVALQSIDDNLTLTKEAINESIIHHNNIHSNELIWSGISKSMEDTQEEIMLSNHYPSIEAGKGILLYLEGNIFEAIKVLESELSIDNTNSENWRYLGLCFAEHDDDKKAILCYKKSVECDPYNLESLVDLGISYVNSLDSVKALETLLAWIQHNPKFYNLKLEYDEYSDGTLMNEVEQLMIRALTHSPNDPDVNLIIGVLYNVSQNLDEAVQCFLKFASVHSNDFKIFNKVSFIIIKKCINVIIIVINIIIIFINFR